MPPPPPCIETLRSSAKPLIAFALLACALTSCATSPQREILGPGNPHLKEVRAHREQWTRGAIRDYVFVVQLDSFVIDLATAHSRIVVEDGRVQSATSLLYGGTPDRSIVIVPTIDSLFEDAEAAASYDDSAPHVFEATYDPVYGFPNRVWSNPRQDIADDEGGFTIMCFSVDPNGCAPVWVTAEQCAATHGKIVSHASERGCGPNSSGSIGLINANDACCRYWPDSGTDEITAAQCASAGGRVAACGPMETAFGKISATNEACCRPLMR